MKPSIPSPPQRVALAGNNWLACEVLQFLLRQGLEVLALPEGNDMLDRDAGWERPFGVFAARLARPSSRISGMRGRLEVLPGRPAARADKIAGWRPELLISCRLKSLVPARVLSIPPLGCINAHYGMLPRYGGVQPIPWAIFNGEKEMGVTWHKMEKDWDTGAIVAQETIPIRPVDTAHSLYRTANATALSLFKRTWPRMGEALSNAEPQDPRRRLYFSSRDFDRLRELKDRLDRAFRFKP